MDDEAYGGDEELRDKVEDALGAIFGRSCVDDEVWELLKGQPQFQQLLTSHGYERCACIALGATWTMQQLEDQDRWMPHGCGHRGQRRRFVKPSARRRYSALLEHAWWQCVLQFAEKYGLTEARQDGGQRVRYFDLEMHLHDVFNPDVDFDSIRKAWNAQHPEDDFDDTETFKRVCRRALRHIGDPSVSLALPARGERGPTARTEEARARNRGVLATVNLCRFAAEYHGLRFSWGVAAKIYADSSFGRPVEPETLRSWYHAGLKDEKLHGKPEFAKELLEDIRRRSATWDEYLERVREFTEDMRGMLAERRIRKRAGGADGERPADEPDESAAQG